MPQSTPVALVLVAALLGSLLPAQDPRPRVRDLVAIGRGTPGPSNTITDVAGVRVGHATVRHNRGACTGVTVVLPHGDNPFADKVPAAIVVGNGFGKLAGSTQVVELGELESPIALTNTLSVGTVLDAIVGWTLEQPGNERVRSINGVVGETNDGRLNDIRGRHVTATHVRQALAAAAGPQGASPVTMGSVGAGTGTVCFGYKGGIGSSSRIVDGWTVGVLVQSNFGGDLTIAGVPVSAGLRDRAPPAGPPDANDKVRGIPDGPKRIPRPGGGRRGQTQPRGGGGESLDTGPQEHGSCMIIVATDAPLDARNLERLARRALVGMGRTGASFSNGSGDYVVAFSTAESLRIRADGREVTGGPVLRNDRMSPLFVAAADATEEAILDSMFLSETTVGANKMAVPALPIETVRALLRASHRPDHPVPRPGRPVQRPPGRSDGK